MEKDFITKEEITRDYGIDRTNLDRFCRKGIIPCRKIGRNYIILRELFKEWYFDYMKGDSNGTD